MTVVGRYAALAFALGALSGCGDGGDGEPEEDAFGIRDAASGAADGGSDFESSPEEPNACQGRRLGTSCGNRRHCIDGRCLPNMCGDGIRAGREECDDGNHATGDGCDALCVGEVDSCGNGRLDAGEECDDGDGAEVDGCSDLCAITPYCGDGRVDEGEECDDANAVDDDGCAACLTVLCGNGRLDPGEECDDGNDADDDACANDCTAHECGNWRVEPGEECDGEPYCTSECRRSGEDPCRACEEVYCRNYLDFGFDLVAGCYDGRPPRDVSLEPGPSDEFAAGCIAVTDCVRRHRCALGDQGAAGCYCGMISAEECVADGPAADAPCVEEWLRAARTELHDEAVERLTDWNYPAGLATFLIACDRASCGSECLGAPAPTATPAP